MKLSATIITYNEEKNIARAIKSLQFADEIIVVDSYSNDQTKKIARELGAKVVENIFEGYGQQKNFAAGQCSNQWILSIDADEAIDEELQASIMNELGNIDDSGNQIFLLNRKTSYCGKWIMHGGWYPDRLARMYNKDKASWTEPHVHEELISNSNCNKRVLKGHLEHYSFPTISSQIKTNIKYAKLGARALINKKKNPSILKLLIKPFGKFIECYIIKKGFLDGLHGLIIAINAAHSIFMKYAIAKMEKVSDKDK